MEQSYKQVKQHLGWGEYQVRSDLAMRRHWQLVCCAFSFCWWALTHGEVDLAVHVDISQQPAALASAEIVQAEGKKRSGTNVAGKMARGAAQDSGLARTLPHAQALLASLVGEAPATAFAAAP